MKNSISLKNLRLDNLGITFIEPPECDCCGDTKGSCLKFLIHEDDKVLEGMHGILNSINSEYCLGICFRKDGNTLVADKMLQASKRISTQELEPVLDSLVGALEIKYMLILVEIDTDTFKVLCNTLDTFVLKLNTKNAKYIQ